MRNIILRIYYTSGVDVDRGRRIVRGQRSIVAPEKKTVVSSKRVRRTRISFVLFRMSARGFFSSYGRW